MGKGKGEGGPFEDLEEENVTNVPSGNLESVTDRYRERFSRFFTCGLEPEIAWVFCPDVLATVANLTIS